MKNKLLKQFVTAFLIVITFIMSSTNIKVESVVGGDVGGGGGSTTYTLTVTATFHDYNGTYIDSTSESFSFKKGAIVGYDNISSRFPESYGWNGKNYHLQATLSNVTMNSNKTVTLAYLQSGSSGGGGTSGPATYTITVEDRVGNSSGKKLGSGTYSVEEGLSANASVLRNTIYTGYTYKSDSAEISSVSANATI